MQYEVRALRGKEFISLRLEAVNEQMAISQAQAQGYAVFSTQPLKSNWLVGLIGRKHFPLVLFSQELLTLIEAGLNLFEGIEALAEKEQRPEIRQVLQGVLRALNEGLTVSHAMENFPAAFPPLYVAALRASEKTGGVAESLRRYIAYQSQIDQIKKKVISSSIYPVILILVGGLITLFLMGYVVPRFAHIYGEVGGELPVLSRMLMAWGALLEQHGGLLLGILLTLAVVTGYFFTRLPVQQHLMKWVWRIPALGERLRIIQLARFYRSLGMLLIGGIPIMSALNMVSGLLVPSLRLKMQAAARLIDQGQPISIAMEQNELSTPIALRMLRVGERSGQMGEMMERIAGFYDEETARWIEWFTKLFEPLLMLVIGLIIGGVVLLLYMPIFDLAGSIQ
ncbi:MAG: type II secretion system F family protein [Candidatus Nitrotoga sp.]